MTVIRISSPRATRKPETEPFEYIPNTGRVVFGQGYVQKPPRETEKLPSSKTYVLSTPQQVEQAQSLVPMSKGDLVKHAGIFAEATMHTPTHITAKASKYADESSADRVVSIRGGWNIGLGEETSGKTGSPHTCIPTTYIGSEMTPILGETEECKKTKESDSKILPATVVFYAD